MQITWTSGTATTLCHGHERGEGKATGPADLQIEEPENIQVDQRIRNAAPTLFDRGNRPALVAFTVVQQYASTEAALIAYATQIRLLGKTGTLTLIPGGAQNIVGSNAVLGIESRRLSGVTVTWRYRITCPKLETAAS